MSGVLNFLFLRDINNIQQITAINNFFLLKITIFYFSFNHL